LGTGRIAGEVLVINSGSPLVDLFGAKPIDELTLTNETRATLRSPNYALSK
jgi:hypothetical protein